MKNICLKDLEFTPVPHGWLLLTKPGYVFTPISGISSFYTLSIKGQKPEEEDMEEEAKNKLLYNLFAICFFIGACFGFFALLVIKAV